MFRLYSKGCEYAIRALTSVASGNGKKRFNAEAICRKAGIPESSTRKVLQALVAGEFLEATPGPGGGYKLKDAPDRITLLSIIEAVDGKEAFAGCVLGFPECKASMPRPLHKVWMMAKDDLLEQLDSATLEELIVARGRRARKRSRGKP